MTLTTMGWVPLSFMLPMGTAPRPFAFGASPKPRPQELRSVVMQWRGRRALRPRRQLSRCDGFLHRRRRGEGLCGIGRLVRCMTA